MRLRSPLALAAAVGIAASLFVATPAQAAPQSLFGTTVNVVAQPSGDSLLGGTAYVPVGSVALQAVLGSPLAFDVVVSVRDSGGEVTTCTIVSGNTDCSMSPVGLFSAGATPVTVRFTGDATLADYAGTVFAVTGTAPTVRIEWLDAAGTWVDGSGTSVPLRGDTALRCVVTNNSNAPVTFNSFEGVAFLSPSGTQTTPITGTLGAGATGRYTIWSGQASEVGSASCSGGVSLRDGTGTGNGNGGGVIPIGGTITVDRAPAPGTTVTITGDNVVPPVVSQYAVLLDGVPVAGSPVASPGPDFDFTLAVDIPADLAPGEHVLSVVAEFGDVDSAIAAFRFTVAGPELAATGAATDAMPLLGGALLLFGAGALLLAARRRVSIR